MITVDAVLLLKKVVDDFRLPSPLTLWCLMSFLPHLKNMVGQIVLTPLTQTQLSDRELIVSRACCQTGSLCTAGDEDLSYKTVTTLTRLWALLKTVYFSEDLKLGVACILNFQELSLQILVSSCLICLWFCFCLEVCRGWVNKTLMS